MLKKLQYPIKPARLKIFYIEETKEGSIKQYIMPEGKFIKAYARQLSGSEQASADAVQDSSSYEFVIMKRDLSLTMFIEFNKGYGEKLYEINFIDFREFYKAEITIRAGEINNKTFIETRWL